MWLVLDKGKSYSLKLFANTLKVDCIGRGSPGGPTFKMDLLLLAGFLLSFNQDSLSSLHFLNIPIIDLLFYSDVSQLLFPAAAYAVI